MWTMSPRLPSVLVPDLTVSRCGPVRLLGSVNRRYEQFGQILQRPKFVDQMRVNKNPHALHVIIELLLSQRLYDGRDVPQHPVTALLGKMDFDAEFHFPFYGRGVDEYFMRGDAAAKVPAERRGEFIRASHEPRIRPTSQTIV